MLLLLVTTFASITQQYRYQPTYNAYITNHNIHQPTDMNHYPSYQHMTYPKDKQSQRHAARRTSPPNSSWLTQYVWFYVG